MTRWLIAGDDGRHSMLAIILRAPIYLVSSGPETVPADFLAHSVCDTVIDWIEPMKEPGSVPTIGTIRKAAGDRARERRARATRE